MLELIRRAKGYVCFRILSPTPEEFLNEAAARGVDLWGVYGIGSETVACCTASAYRTAASAARSVGIRLRISRKRGGPFLWLGMKRRPGIPVGMVLFIAVQIVLSGFIWQIDVVGAQTLTEQQVLQAAEQIGLYTGMHKSGVSVNASRHDLLQIMPELAWAAVNQIGCRLEIQIRESARQPDIIPNHEPCNMVARIGGIILRTQAEDGFAVVHTGDVVQAGDLLVEGLRVDAYEGTILHHAYGLVYAITSHTFTAEQPLTYAAVQDTGHTVVRKRWRVFGVDIPLTLTAVPETGYRRTYEERPIFIRGIELPMRICTETWIRQDTRQMVCTEEEATAMARRKISDMVRSQIPEAQILNIEESVQMQGGTVILTRTLTCVEDIAVQVPIEMGDQGITP